MCALNELFEFVIELVYFLLIRTCSHKKKITKAFLSHIQINIKDFFSFSFFSVAPGGTIMRVNEREKKRLEANNQAERRQSVEWYESKATTSRLKKHI